ncbi:MAG: nicotinate-nucleotide adenylyltransferase [Pirellulales bacterium]|nr:nicotinate-nucleotide adenylyltransferase [Pirellulales bacterium]
MRLGLFGGTFDPIHYGHLLLAECCREQARLDEVWFLPTAVPPHKQGQELTSAEVRIEMLDLAIAGHAAFSVCRYEADRGGVNFTVDTLSHFREECPEDDLFFLLGADMLHDLPTWREAARVCELATPIVVCRPGTGELDFDCLARIATAGQIERVRLHQVAMPEIGISGTELRRRAAVGESLRYQTPRAVQKYIETHGLYCAATCQPAPLDGSR